MITVCRIELTDQQRRIIEATLHKRAGLASRATVAKLAGHLFDAFLQVYADQPDQIGPRQPSRCTWCRQTTCICPEDREDP